jgi:hypothetical protein
VKLRLKPPRVVCPSPSPAKSRCPVACSSARPPSAPQPPKPRPRGNKYRRQGESHCHTGAKFSDGGEGKSPMRPTPSARIFAKIACKVEFSSSTANPTSYRPNKVGCDPVSTLVVTLKTSPSPRLNGADRSSEPRLRSFTSGCADNGKPVGRHCRARHVPGSIRPPERHWAEARGGRSRTSGTTHCIEIERIRRTGEESPNAETPIKRTEAHRLRRVVPPRIALLFR